MNTASHSRAVGLIGVLAAVLIGSSVVSDRAVAGLGPPEPVQPLRNKKPLRKPVIDLEKASMEIRPGQVVPDAEVTREPAAREQPPTAPPAPALPPKPATAERSPSNAAIPGPAPKAPAPVADDGARPVEPAAADAADLPPSAAGEPVKVVVLSAYTGDGDGSRQAQWRSMGGADASWRPVEVGSRTEERLEIRTGLTGTVRIEVDGVITVQVDRLSRVRVERRARSDASELSVELVRGRVEVQPIKTDDLRQGEPVRIRTQDAVLLRRTAVAVTYDAFKGTRESALPVR